jgi:hypothetical protein
VSNQITLSPDRREMTVTGPNGEVATLRSARPGGFITIDVDKARDFAFNQTLIPGEVRRAWLRHIGHRPVLITVNTGPPTWWWPRVEVRKDRAMVGWLRGLIGVMWHTSSGRKP